MSGGKRRARAVLEAWCGLPRQTRRLAIRPLPSGAVGAIAQEWWAHGGQIEPKECPSGGPWRVWAIVAGRGFGKTRAGAEWVWARARENGEARIALVAASLDEVAKVMVEGDSGLLAAARHGERPRWLRSRGVLYFPSGAQGHAFTADRPDKLRGPQHHLAWCDELAKWPNPDSTWDNLMLGLRLGDRPRAIVTTTPKPVPLLKRILARPDCATTGGRTDENPHLPADFREAVELIYGGTRLGRQELDGVIIDEPEGALWTRAILDRVRCAPALPEGRAALDMHRIVVAIDPPASASGDACGIVVCGLDGEGIMHVLADLSAGGLSPEGWARRAVSAAELWGAQKIVAEKNQGGEMIDAVLRGVGASLPVKLVAATGSKAARAEPVALRFETGAAKLAGSFPELEDQLCAITYRGYEGPGSPDRADAMVWAMTELIRPTTQPRISSL